MQQGNTGPTLSNLFCSTLLFDDKYCIPRTQFEKPSVATAKPVFASMFSSVPQSPRRPLVLFASLADPNIHSPNIGGSARCLASVDQSLVWSPSMATGRWVVSPFWVSHFNYFKTPSHWLISPYRIYACFILFHLISDLGMIVDHLPRFKSFCCLIPFKLSIFSNQGFSWGSAEISQVLLLVLRLISANPLAFTLPRARA